MLLNIATGIAVAATAAVVFLPAAYAAPGVVTGNVNVRSGPGTNYAVVDVVARGTQVDVQQCQGSWCYINKSGPDGWVSASYLSAGGRPVNPSQPGLSFGFTIGGPNGPQISIGVGNQPQPRPPVVRPLPEPIFGEVCFYDRTRFRGSSFCLESGDSIRNLGDWTDRISSLENYRNCRTYTTSASSLGDFDDYIVSVRVR
jgi:hypothetical protein